MWQGTYRIPTAAPNGLWTIHDLFAIDVATNRVDITDPEPPAPDGSFTVVGGTNDTTPPSVMSFSSSPKTVSPGDLVTFTAQITDAGSGVSQAGMCVRTPSGSVPSCLSFTRTSGTSQSGTWQGTYRIPTAAPAGLWTIHDLFAIDVATNRVDITDPEPPAPDGSFTVIGGTNDTAPPTVVTFASSPKSVSSGDLVTFTARITDSGSGVSQAGMCVRTPSGSVPSCLSFTRISGTSQDGTWQGTYRIPAAAPAGLWTVHDLFAIDVATNRVDITDPAPPAPDGSFTVRAFSCQPRPRVSVTATASADRKLRVVVAATDPLNALLVISFGSSSNGLIELPGQQPITGNTTVTLPPGTTSFVFHVSRAALGSVTVPFVVQDGCGDWRTFVGGGPAAF